MPTGKQERTVQGGGELDVDVGRADLDLPQQRSDVQPRKVRLRSRRRLPNGG
jgi:hypothetical protein